MVTSWSRLDDADEAADRLLDVAGAVFAEVGPAAATVADIARAAGCSRQTVHRYFGDRDGLRLAFVEREARAIQGEVAARLDRRHRRPGRIDHHELVVTAVMEALAAVERRTALRRWFEPASIGITVGLSQVSAVIIDGIEALLTRVDIDHRRTGADVIRRTIVSLLTDPPSTRAETERVTQMMVRGTSPG